MLQVALEELAEEAASAGSSGAIAEVAAEMSLYRKKSRQVLQWIEPAFVILMTCVALTHIAGTATHGKKRRIT